MGLFDWIFKSGKKAAKAQIRAIAAPKKLSSPAIKVDMFPSRRLIGAAHVVIFTPSSDPGAARDDEWDTYFASEEFRVFCRPKTTKVLDFANLIEIKPTGKSAENMAETAIYDIAQDIEAFAKLTADEDEDDIFSNQLKLVRTKDRISIVSVFSNYKKCTIGYLPDPITEAINVKKIAVSNLGVEFIEARINSTFEKPKVRFSVSLFQIGEK